MTATTAEIATALETDPRTLRKFLRDTMGEGKAVVGKGKRYALPSTKRDITALNKKFIAWGEAKAAKVEATETVTEVETDNLDDEGNEVETDEYDEPGEGAEYGDEDLDSLDDSIDD